MPAIGSMPLSVIICLFVVPNGQEGPPSHGRDRLSLISGTFSALLPAVGYLKCKSFAKQFPKMIYDID
jgi:hypothetical protein